MSSSPENVVQAQVDAYNDQDVERFAATYSPTVELRRLPDNDLRKSGHAEIRDHYARLFQERDLHAEIVNRILLGEYVIDLERISVAGSGEVVRTVAIYQVRDDLIQRVWFIHE